MISNEIIHVHLGLTGGHVVRKALGQLLGGKIKWLESRAHLPLRHARKHFTQSAPAFTVIRNPFDWYIAWYLCELKNHRWRGTFRDWFYHRREGDRKFDPPTPTGMWMWKQWLYMTEVVPGEGPAVDYVCHFENLLEDMIYILKRIVPDLVNERVIREKWPVWSCMGWARDWTEGIETWMRDEMWAPDMIEEVYDRDAPIFERFGYTFKEKYYFGSGIPPSFHEDKRIGWEYEKCRSDNWRTKWEKPKPWKPSS